MSRNKNADYTQYVHEFVNERGETRYAVAEWNQQAGQYQRPLTAKVAKLTGCFAEFCRNLNYFGGYVERKDALRRARYLFGPSNDGE